MSTRDSYESYLTFDWLRPDGHPVLRPSNGRTVEEVRAIVADLVATIDEIAKRIDPETCEILGMHVNCSDPYGLFELADGSNEAEHQWPDWDTANLVRMPDTDWVVEWDLPREKIDALYARIHRKAA
jgi:hypothetical protein